MHVDSSHVRLADGHADSPAILHAVSQKFSVYCRHCASEENADVHIARVERNVPADGEVRILLITDKQFERMRVFWGKRRKPPESPAAQLELF